MTRTPDLNRLRKQLKREGGQPQTSVVAPPEAGWWACGIDLLVPGLGHLLQRRYAPGIWLIVAFLLLQDISALVGGLRIGAALSSLVYGLNRRQ